MSQYTNLTLDIVDHTALVTLSNPSANTFTRDGLMALTQLVHDLNANRDVVSLVVTGQGEKAVFEIAGEKFEVFNGQTLEQRRPAAR